MKRRISDDIIMNLPLAYSLNQLLVDEQGVPYDYIILEVNPAFEEEMQLRASDIIGKRVTEILPKMKSEELNWRLLKFSRVAMDGRKMVFEIFQTHNNSYYKVNSFSTEKGYFVSTFENMTEKINIETKMLENESVVKRQEILLDIYSVRFDDQNEFLMYIQQKTLELTSSEFVNLCLYDETLEEFRITSNGNEVALQIQNSNDQSTLQDSMRHVWQKVVVEKNYIIFNSSQKPSYFTKPYHQYKYHMSLPIIVNEQVVAVVDLANNSHEYSDFDANQVMILLQSGWSVHKQKDLIERIQVEEQKYKIIFNALSALVCEFQTDGKMTFVNEACCDYFGKTPQQLLGRSIQDFIPSEERAEVSNRYLNLTIDKPYATYTHSIQVAGHVKWIEWRGTAVFDQQGNYFTFYAIGLDITEKKRVSDEKDKQLSHFNAMINGTHANILVVDPISGTILDANPAAIEFYGYSIQELRSMNIAKLNMLDEDTVRESLTKALVKEQQHFTFPHRLKSGEIKMVDVFSSQIEYDNQSALCSIIFDVTDREDALKEIKKLAYHDHLTAINNRRYLELEFDKKNRSEHFPLAIILGDLNGLKLINDSFGHTVGDEMLKETAQRINSFLREGEVVARIGGDEFAILMTGTNEKEVQRLIQNLDSINRERVVNTEDRRKSIGLSISFGYAMQKNHGDSLDTLMKEAGVFMYRRKFYNSRSMKSKTIKAIMMTLFEKSEREQKHSARVSLLCETIALKMNLDEVAINRIRVAGLFHDIGKIGINESILNKPNSLADDEWEIMKSHPAKSARILENTVEYKDISDVVLSHHERYDGRGYPKGLKGDEIPLESRIISVADAFDVMTTERPYRAPMTQEEAIVELKSCAGKQFDPNVVSVFIAKVLSK